MVARPRTVLLGPQRRPTVDAVVASLELGDGGLATVTAGWQEREPDDAELDALLGRRSRNLRLHARWLDVLERDPELALAERDHRATLEDLQALYVVQLDAAIGAIRAVAQRDDTRPRVRTAALDDAVEIVRRVDARHVDRVTDARTVFSSAWRLGEREVVAEHRAAVRRALDSSSALVLAGGHVGVLLHVLRLFVPDEAVGQALPPTVVAWSAGAMALTERVFLFHDNPARGPARAEVLDRGLGVVPGLVLLPHARRRLDLADEGRMGVLARRASPARCLLLDDGVRVDLGPGAELPPDARVIHASGRVAAVGVAA
jgi:hypothetical protein